jgi:aminoglycoside phosphotransferase (APT) family kinase protein
MAISQSDDLLDTGAALAAWEQALQAPPWTGRRVWTHGDLLPPNLLAVGGHLSGVVDFGNLGAGDPAVDVIAAWTLFGGAARRVFRHALDVDAATWARSRGLALCQALLIIPYYQKTNPPFTAMAQRTVAQILADEA